LAFGRSLKSPIDPAKTWPALQHRLKLGEVNVGAVVELPFTGPNGHLEVAEDTSGNIYILDSSTGVFKLPAGSITKVQLPFTGLNGPLGVAVDRAGSLYVTDSNNNRVLKLPVQQ
jgi:serine/threonine protein kinase, bacterial